MPNDLTRAYIDRLWNMSVSDIPEHVIDEAKKCLLDYIACAYAGSSRVYEKLLTGGDLILRNKGEVYPVGINKKLPLQSAAFINGLSSHLLELDDGHRIGIIHTGSAIISALLPVIQLMDNISGERFIKSVVIGYEAGISLAASIQPDHRNMGFHGSGTCGCIGAAVALAYLLKVDKEKWNSVISAAATSSAGLLAMMDGGSGLKPYNTGQAAAAAINAVLVGSGDFNGPDDILGNKRGFIATHSKVLKEEYLTEGFAGKYAIELIYRKPYAACRHCHPSIEAALSLRNECSIGSIKEIIVETYNLAVTGHDHSEINGISSAKMSIPYSISAALVLGYGTTAAYSEENVSRKDILDLARKVQVVESEELSKKVPDERSARVTIVTDNDRLTRFIRHPKGEPENPITGEELDAKFMDLMKSAGIDDNKSRRILGYINKIEKSYGDFIGELQSV